jgi:hypothetical protein
MDELFYSVGTISATNGDATFTGSGTLFEVDPDHPVLMEGDELVILSGDDETPYRLLSVDSDTVLEATRPWQGTTASGLTYIVYKTSPFRNETPRLLDWVRDLISSVREINDVITLEDVNSAVNTLKLSNSIAGAGPKIESIGSDTNVPLNYVTKGTGAHRWTIGSTLAMALVAASLTAPAFIPETSTVPSNGMYLPAANTLGWAVNSAAEMRLTAAALSPAVSDGLALGTASLPWADADFASGAVIRFNNSYTLTHSSGQLTANGGISVNTYLGIAGGNTNSVIFSNLAGTPNKYQLGRSVSGDNAQNFFLYDIENAKAIFTVNATTWNFGSGTIVTINSSTASTSQSNGALVVAGGAGIGGVLCTGAAGYFGLGNSGQGLVNINGASGFEAVVGFSISSVRMFSMYVASYASNGLVLVDAGYDHGVLLTQDSNSWSAVSDERLPWKKNREPVSVLSAVEKFDLFAFNNKGAREYGVLAQQLHKAFPFLVNVGDDEDRVINDLSEPGAWSVMYDRAGIVALGGVKELKVLGDARDAEIAGLRTRVAELESRLAIH